MNEKQKEIMHEICKVKGIFPYWKSIIAGDSVQNPKMCRFGTFDKDLIWHKCRVSHYINKISAPTLDVCYHIKHKNIVLTKNKDVWFDTYHYLNYTVRGEAVITAAASEENICIYYNGTIIDIRLFNDTEKKVIWYYVEQRIKEIMKEEKQKKKGAVEQKRKELIVMFNNI